MPVTARRTADLVARRTLRTGFQWVSLTTLISLLTVAFFFLRTPQIAEPAYYFSYAALTLCVLAAVLFRYPRSLAIHLDTWDLSALALAGAWACAALSVYYCTSNANTAQKLLLVGFFVFMLGFYSRIGLLLTTLTALIAAYAFLMVHDTDAPLLAMLISLSVFPVLLAFFLVTIRKRLVVGERRYVENLRLVRQLETITRTDELTGLLNRKGFNEALSNALNHVERFGEPLSLIIIDIDFFKHYNDALGHPAGDKCLSQVASLLQNAAKRTIDVTARLGGEEFALVLPGSDIEQAAKLAELIRSAVNSANILHPQSPIAMHVTASYGCAQLSEGDDGEALYRNADKALYFAKQNGRNRVQCFANQ